MDLTYVQSLERRLANLEALLGRLARATDNGGTGGGGASNLDGLSDVVLSATAAGDVLKYDGAQWVDGPVDATNIDATLKPSGTAAAGTEALRALGTTGSTAAAGNDARLSDARTPTAHAASHAAAGSDALTLTAAQISNFAATVGGTAVGGDLSGTVAAATVVKADAATYGKTRLSTAPAVAATPIAVGDNDTRMTNARTPTAHAASHAAAGSDPITISESQVTNLVADLALKAPLASPALTGVPTAPTAPDGTNTTQLATMAALQSALGTPTTSRPSARVYSAANQSIATGTDTAVIFGSERFDTDTIHDTVTNNTRLTAQTAGLYVITAHVNFDINATGWRSVMLRVNGTTVIAEDREIAAAGIEQRIPLTTMYQLSAGDYVEVVVRQTSGVALNLVTQANYGIEAGMAFVGATTQAWGNARAEAQRAATQSVANNTDTAISWDTEVADSDNMFATSPNPTRLTASTPGTYIITATATWSANPVDGRIRLSKSGAGIANFGSEVIGDNRVMSFAWITSMNAGDYIEVFAKQISGGAINITTASVAIARVGYQSNPSTFPSARVYNNAAISHAISGTAQALTFNSERHDNANLHDTVTNTSRLTAPVAGVYDISGHIDFAANATGARAAQIRVNGTTIIANKNEMARTDGNAHTISIQTQYKLAAGDYVELLSNQFSGGALNINASPNYSPEFAMTKISEG
jgi:hypothetical protein